MYQQDPYLDDLLRRPMQMANQEDLVDDDFDDEDDDDMFGADLLARANLRKICFWHSPGSSCFLSPTDFDCGLVGRATTFVGGDVGSIPTGGALEVWPWTFGSRTAWLVNKSAGQPQFRRCGPQKATQQ